MSPEISPSCPPDGALARSLGEDETRAPSWCVWLLVALLLYFAGRLVFFAVGIAPFVPPDEVTHFGKCVVFSQSALFPDNTADSYEYGLVTNIPWLYYWAMGKVLLLNFFGMSDLTFLRLCNIPLVFGTLWYAWRMLRLLTRDPLAGLLLVVLLTNTLMFSFVSASISYDNLTNLLAAASLYYLFSFFRDRSGIDLALAMVLQLAGCLTKLTFLPLLLLSGLLLLLHEWRGLSGLPQAVARFFRSTGARGALLALAIVVGVLLNLQLYGGNLLRYKHLEVETYDVLPLEHALKYRLAARSYIVDGYMEKRISFEKAQEMAQSIDHPGDRKDTMNLVLRHKYFIEDRGEPLLGFASYLGVWGQIMWDSFFGIKAHQGMAHRGPSSLALGLVLLTAGGAFLFRYRPREGGFIPAAMALTAAGYLAFLLFGINYSTYLVYRDPFLSVSGRYLFPVLVPLYVLASWCLMRLSAEDKVRLALFAACALTFIWSDFPYFLANATPAFFAHTPQ